MITINGKLFVKVDTGANWTSNNPVLENKQQGFDSTARAFKIGDGSTAWNSLPYYYNNAILLPSIVSIPAGTTINVDTYVHISYTSYTAHGNYPTLEVDLLITGAEEIQYVSVKKLKTAGNITEILVFLPDAGDGTTEGDYQLIIK